jgi:hypothetical protein
VTVLDRDGPIVVAGTGVARANELKHITELDGRKAVITIRGFHTRGDIA